MYYFLDVLILPIFFATVFFLFLGGQASQIAEKCLQGCQSKALLSPENIGCPVDEISSCACNWKPLITISFCCLVDNCLLSPEEAINQWASDCARVGVVDTALPLKITCSGSGKELSSTLNSIQSSKVSSFSFDPNAEFAITRILTDFDSFTIVPENTKLSLPTSRASTPKSSTAVSIGGSTTFNSQPFTKISTPTSPSPTTTLPPAAPKTTSDNDNDDDDDKDPEEITAGYSRANDEKKTKKKKLGIILGLSIPAALVSFLAVIFFRIRRQKSKQKGAEVPEQDEATSSGISKERHSDIPEEGGGGPSGYGNKEKACRLSELHSDPIPPYSRELPGTPAPRLVELPG